MAGEIQHTIRWGNPGTTQWGTVILERATAWEGVFAADGNWGDSGTVSIFSGSAFRGSYVDANGGTDSYYRFRYTDGTYYSDWSDPLWAHQPRAFCGVRDIRQRCAAVWDWFPDTPSGTELEALYQTAGEVTREIESRLDPVFPVPIQAGTDGQYDESLIDACANLTISRLALWHYSGREMPEEFDRFREFGDARIERLKSGQEALRYLVTPDEVGFTEPLPDANNSGDGIFEVDRMQEYTGARRCKFVAEVTTSGAFSSAVFKFSEDGGISWRVTGKSCGSQWIGLGAYGARVRFRGSDESDLYDFVSGDRWTWHGYSTLEAGRTGQVVSRELIRG